VIGKSFWLSQLFTVTGCVTPRSKAIIVMLPELGSSPDSIRAAGVVRAIQREQGNRHHQRVAGMVLKRVAALHEAGRGRERASGRILETAAGPQHGLLADHALADHFLATAVARRDLPPARDQPKRPFARDLAPDGLDP